MEVRFIWVQKNNFDLLHTWLKSDHLKWFYDGGDLTWKEFSIKMIEKIDHEFHFPYIFFIDNIPVWYIQCYDCHEYAGDVYRELVGKWTWWVDMYIWDNSYMWKWIWSMVLKKFVKFLMDTYWVTSVSIDPKPTNMRAIKAYKKAWFQEIKEFTIDGNTHLLMICKNT